MYCTFFLGNLLGVNGDENLIEVCMMRVILGVE